MSATFLLYSTPFPLVRFFVFLSRLGPGLTLFSVLHFGQSLRYRAWWLLPTAVLAGVGEVIGWGGRLWSNYAPLNNNAYLIQYVLLYFHGFRMVLTPVQDRVHNHRSHAARRCHLHHVRAALRVYGTAIQPPELASL